MWGIGRRAHRNSDVLRRFWRRVWLEKAGLLSLYVARDGKIVNRVFGLVSRSEIESDIQKALAQKGEVAQK